MEYARPLKYQFPLIRGEDVRAVQQALMALHIQPPCGSADGVYGDLTALTVNSFQGQYNVVGRTSGEALPVDGQVDQSTWGAIFNRAVAVNATASRVVNAAAAVQSAAATAATVAPKPNPVLSEAQVKIVRQWMSSNFGAAIAEATAKGPFDADLVYAIACQETALVWLPWIDTLSPDQVLAHCVFDASGDAPGTTRKAFPVNTAAFRNQYGDAVTQQFINVANEMRSLRRLPPAQWVYKGYGIFQYDLQNMAKDPDFFLQGRWSDFRACLDRLLAVLNEKLSQSGGSVAGAVQRYNGGGDRAAQYAANVLKMRDWSAAGADAPALA